jgi:hypothetical protein
MSQAVKMKEWQLIQEPRLSSVKSHWVKKKISEGTFRECPYVCKLQIT